MGRWQGMSSECSPLTTRDRIARLQEQLFRHHHHHNPPQPRTEPPNRSGAGSDRPDQLHTLQRELLRLRMCLLECDLQRRRRRQGRVPVHAHDPATHPPTVDAAGLAADHVNAPDSRTEASAPPDAARAGADDAGLYTVAHPPLLLWPLPPAELRVAERHRRDERRRARREARQRRERAGVGLAARLLLAATGGTASAAPDPRVGPASSLAARRGRCDGKGAGRGRGGGERGGEGVRITGSEGLRGVGGGTDSGASTSSFVLPSPASSGFFGNTPTSSLRSSVHRGGSGGSVSGDSNTSSRLSWEGWGAAERGTDDQATTPPSDNAGVGSRSPCTPPTQGKPTGARASAGSLSHGTATHGTVTAEMEAIAHGRADPYRAYLFAPHTRVVDLAGVAAGGAGEFRASGTQPTTSTNLPHPPRLEATCVGFSPAGTCYVVGDSRGTLFHVPVPRPSDAVTHATYLGGLYRGGSAVTGHPAPAPPTPLLLAHSAAVTSIAFNDDGSMFASASVDMSVMLWGTAKLAKLRRLHVGAPPTISPAAVSPAAAASALARAAPRFALFTPGNNNYLLVCSRREGVLYNGSTGRPVGAPLGGRTGAGGGGRVGAGAGEGKGGRRPGGGGAPSGEEELPLVTSVCMDPACAPFFFLGDSHGSVQLCTYRAGELATLPTLRAPAPTRTRPGSGPLMGRGSPARAAGEAEVARLHSRELPELRALTSLAFHRDGGAQGGPDPAPLPIARLEVVAMNATQGLSILKAQQRVAPGEAERAGRGYWPACERAPVAAASRDGLGRALTRDRPNSAERVLAEGASRVVGAVESLWAAATSAISGSASHGRASGTHQSRRGVRVGLARADAASSSSSSSSSSTANATTSIGAAAAPTEEPPPSAALERLCALTLLVTLPCDTVSLVGIVVEPTSASTGTHGAKHRRGEHDHKPSSGSNHHRHHHRAAPSGPPRYTLVKLLDIRGVGRLRHVGAGAIPCHDNARLIAMAVPCEEGFLRIVVTSAGAAASPATATGVRPPTWGVAATLLLPSGGPCTDLAWSPGNRFLVAVTREGVLYQWERVYLVGAGEAAAPAVDSPLTPRARGARGVESLPQPYGEVRHGAGAGAGAVGGGDGDTHTASVRCVDPVELEEESWRDGLLRERAWQVAMREQRRKNWEPGAGGSGESSQESSGYWLDGSDMGSASTQTTSSWSAGAVGGGR